MDERKATRHKIYILLFGVTTFTLSLVIAYLKAREFWLANGGDLTIEESYQMYGDLASWAIGMTTMAAFLIIAPVIYIFSGSFIYGIGILYAQWKSDQLKFVKFWLVYPITSIFLLLAYYLFAFFR